MSEVRSAMRSKGIAAVEDVAAVVLETNGSLSVLPTIEPARRSALQDVEGLES